MIKSFTAAAARPIAGALALTILGALAVLGPGSKTFAEEKKATSKAKPGSKTAPKAEPKAEPKQPPQQQAAPELPPLIFSPWTKFCPRGQEANAKQVCFTGRDGRVESGQPVVSAVLIEPEGEPRKVLRVTLPLGMSLQPGTRVIVDQGQPMTAPYVICFANGCLADYEASGELINSMRKGQGLAVQGINGAGQPITLVLPLNDFAKAYDGPPADPELLKKQQDDLQRRFEEGRKKLEGRPK